MTERIITMTERVIIPLGLTLGIILVAYGYMMIIINTLNSL
jgi:hypothetical protein